MESAIMSLLGFGASAALVIWGVMVRRGMGREGQLHGVGMIPARAAREAS